MNNKHSIYSSVLTIQKCAFTLAETLIVIGIIGVVAALTLPNLNSSTDDKEKVVKLVKIYTNLNDAFGRAVAVYGSIDTWHISDSSEISVYSSRFGSRLADFLKISKNCGIKANENCFYSSGAKFSNGTASGIKKDSDTNYYKFILSDGVSVGFERYLECYNDFIDDEAVCGWVYIDISGPNKGKHMCGYDVFDFYITENGFVPIGIEKDVYGDTKDKLLGNCFKTGIHCGGWVIKNLNMDYLKAKNGACNSGSVNLSWSNTTCK